MDHPRTKLVCTIGPASVERVRELIDAGMDVARINFSHGTPDDQRNAIRAVRAAAREARRTIAVLADLPGPKIRMGLLSGHRVELATGSRFVLRAPVGGTPPTPDDPPPPTTHESVAEATTGDEPTPAPEPTTGDEPTPAPEPTTGDEPTPTP